MLFIFYKAAVLLCRINRAVTAALTVNSVYSKFRVYLLPKSLNSQGLKIILYSSPARNTLKVKR